MTNTPPTIPSGPGIRRVGIPPVTSFDQGEELRTVMDLLGHSTIRLTADTYGHVLPLAQGTQWTPSIEFLEVRSERC